MIRHVLVVCQGYISPSMRHKQRGKKQMVRGVQENLVSMALINWIAAAFLLLSSTFIVFPGTEAIGVNYGMLGNNLPTREQVVALYKSKNIHKLRLYNPDSSALQALQGSGIQAILGTLNEDLQMLASSPSFATNWVATNVAPYAKSVNFSYITAGNEVIPGTLANYVYPAIQNLDSALQAANLSIPVTTSVSTEVLGVSYPPSQGAFSQNVTPIMSPIVSYLASKQSPLLVNVYPYFAYSGDPQNVRLDYALFTAQGVVVQDGSLGYNNLFDAIVDSLYSALEKTGQPNLEVVVSETGWPSGGGANGATIDNAKIYNNNVIAHVNGETGTPKRPGKSIETYLFAMFNENQKPAGTEQNFGLFHPDMTEVYPVDFSS
ncbi:Glycoside hydrolase family 17 protein [Dioscorea alata]|uniref:Glycoside hydrolase family 17 protein n=1 Tax=Dioscorea alata TaxID=55571 RepID=A0ACB7VSD0_DIOAL|nr:Glycoside hydrolase family 17 protein [Dioscorea alata]